MRRKGDYKASMGEDLRPAEARSSAGGFGTSRFGEAPASGTRATQNYSGNDELARAGVSGFGRGSVDAVPTGDSPSGGQGLVQRPKIDPVITPPPIMDPPAPVPGQPTPKYPGGPGTTPIDGGATTRTTLTSSPIPTPTKTSGFGGISSGVTTTKLARPSGGFASPSRDAVDTSKHRAGFTRNTSK